MFFFVFLSTANQELEELEVPTLPVFSKEEAAVLRKYNVSVPVTI